MAGSTANVAVVVSPKRRPRAFDFVIRLIKQKPLATIGGIIVIVMFLTGIFANFLIDESLSEGHLVAS